MRSSSSGCCKTLFEVFRIGCWLVALHLREELWVANYLTVLLFVLIGPCCTWLVHIWLEQLDIQEMILVRRLTQLQCLRVQLSPIMSEREEKTMTGAKVWHDSCITVWRTGQEVLVSYFPSTVSCRASKKEDSAGRTQDKVLNIYFLPKEEGWLTEASHNYNLLFRQDLCKANHQIETFSYSASTLVIPHSAINVGEVYRETVQCSTVNLTDFQWKSMCWDTQHPLEDMVIRGKGFNGIFSAQTVVQSSRMTIVSIQSSRFIVCQRSLRSCSAKATYLMRIRANPTREGLSA